jgi:hypothetical protein
MTKGLYARTPEIRAKMSAAHQGHQFSAETRAKMSAAHLGQYYRGDDAGYSAVHLRIRTAYGNADHCEHCGATDDRRYEWAYGGPDHAAGGLPFSADFADYIQLCKTCHIRFDDGR